MRKGFQKGIQRAVALAVCLVAVMLAAAVPVHAEETADFDFSFTWATVGAGKTIQLNVFCTNRYSVFVTDNTSKDTKIGYTGLAGNQTATLYIGADEESSTVYFWFYPRDKDYNFIDDSYKRCVTIRVNPTGMAGKVTETTAAASSVDVGLSDGTVGNAKTLENATVGLLSAENGTPLAAFAVTADGKHQPFIITGAGKGFLYVTIQGSAAGAAPEISDADKTAAELVGIYGLVINGTPYFF